MSRCRTRSGVMHVTASRGQLGAGSGLEPPPTWVQRPPSARRTGALPRTPPWFSSWVHLLRAIDVIYAHELWAARHRAEWDNALMIRTALGLVERIEQDVTTETGRRRYRVGHTVLRPSS